MRLSAPDFIIFGVAPCSLFNSDRGASCSVVQQTGQIGGDDHVYIANSIGCSLFAKNLASALSQLEYSLNFAPVL